MTTRDIRAHLCEMHQVEVSPDLISRVTDGVLEELAEWQSRPLDAGLPGGLHRRARAPTRRWCAVRR
jgi:putative transposase